MNLKWSSIATAFLIVAYILFSHAAIHFEQPVLMLYGLASLSAGLLFKGLVQLSVRLWVIFLITLCSLYALFYFHLLDVVGKIPPIVILAVLTSVFWSTLLPGKVPLITGIGEQAKGPLPDALRQYTVMLTKVWAIVLAVQLLICLILSVVAPLWLWSIVTYYINYLVVALLFVCEYFYRCSKFPDHDHPSFIDYVKIVIASNVRKPR